jgi:hypothetical protein
MLPSPSNDFALIDLTEMRLNFSQCSFIEEDPLPADAEVIGQAWKKTNKDGSPDRRFSDNYQIPVVKYAEIEFRSKGGFTITRLMSDTPYGPLTRQEAVRLRRAIIIIVDAGRGPSGNWAQTVEGPGGTELLLAAADTAIDSSVRASFTAFKSIMDEWAGTLVRWRCALSPSERAKLGAPVDWDCRDLRFYVSRIGFDHLGPERAAALNAVPSRFALPPEQVDALITAGGDALRNNVLFREFLASVGQTSSQRPRVTRPVAHGSTDLTVAAAR